MVTELHKPGHNNGKRGLTPFAKALVRAASDRFAADYGPHADWLGIGAADIHQLPEERRMEYGHR